ncbi:MAG: hypothetical protein HXX09_14825 [Bacteroidetes bacterium]|nr:hypothetical protein [Bacteroidota bacterium]
MKKQILYILILGLFSFTVYSQNTEKKEIIQFQEDAKTYKNYVDPTFPDISKHLDIQDPTIADYAKQHPPIPLKINTGNEQFDQTDWEIKVNNWVAANPYFPQFIEYHKYNRLLTAEDDLIFYNTAKAEWIKRNPEKYKEISKESDK